MIISDFTKPELDYFRQMCNFVDIEAAVFERRSRGQTLESIAEELHLSIDGVKKISRKVNQKIKKVQ